jgi:hypothetical protein
MNAAGCHLLVRLSGWVWRWRLMLGHAYWLFYVPPALLALALLALAFIVFFVVVAVLASPLGFFFLTPALMLASVVVVLLDEWRLFRRRAARRLEVALLTDAERVRVARLFIAARLAGWLWVLVSFAPYVYSMLPEPRHINDSNRMEWNDWLLMTYYPIFLMSSIALAFVSRRSSAARDSAY